MRTARMPEPGSDPPRLRSRPWRRPLGLQPHAGKSSRPAPEACRGQGLERLPRLPPAQTGSGSLSLPGSPLPWQRETIASGRSEGAFSFLDRESARSSLKETARKIAAGSAGARASGCREIRGKAEGACGKCAPTPCPGDHGRRAGGTGRARASFLAGGQKRSAPSSGAHGREIRIGCPGRAAGSLPGCRSATGCKAPCGAPDRGHEEAARDDGERGPVRNRCRNPRLPRRCLPLPRRRPARGRARIPAGPPRRTPPPCGPSPPR